MIKNKYNLFVGEKELVQLRSWKFLLKLEISIENGFVVRWSKWVLKINQSEDLIYRLPRYRVHFISREILNAMIILADWYNAKHGFIKIVLQWQNKATFCSFSLKYNVSFIFTVPPCVFPYRDRPGGSSRQRIHFQWFCARKAVFLLWCKKGLLYM